MIEFLTQPTPTWFLLGLAASALATALFLAVVLLNWAFDEQNPVE